MTSTHKAPGLASSPERESPRQTTPAEASSRAGKAVEPGKAKGRVGIIGGGVAGLVAGYELAKAGLQVTIMEQDKRMGGLAGSFAVGPDQEIEKYYHFICKPDKPYFDLMRELSLSSRLRWVTTEMGLFFKGEVRPIGDPFSLLAFPHLSLEDKARFCLSTATAKLGGTSSWKALEDVQAEEWLVKQYGKNVYYTLYSPLLNLKFREHAPKISAAWMWARFHRLGNSRTITQKERVGYLEGGSQVYVDALVHALREHGAALKTSTKAERVTVEGGRATGVRCAGELLPFDYVISTVPVPQATALLTEAGGPYFDKLRRLEYIGVRVMVMRLRRRFSRYFWLNVSDPAIDLPGIVEYTNLNPCRHLGGDAVLYLPQYLPATHPLYETEPEELFALYCKYLHQINPAFEPDWVKDYWVYRDRFAQPICEMGFAAQIPSIETTLDGFYLTDSYQLHPYDRSIAGSTDLGRTAARQILSKRNVG